MLWQGCAKKDDFCHFSDISASDTMDYVNYERGQ
jgi:hypothetical protein